MQSDEVMSALFPPFVVVCGLLVVAGVAKLRAPAGLRAALYDAGLHLPVGALRSLGSAEVVIGAWALARPGVLTATLVAVSYAVFGAFLLSARPERCGCFGAARTPAGPAHAILNALACVVAVAAAIFPPPGIMSALSRPALIALPLALGLAAAVAAAYLTFTAFPAAWHAYGTSER